MDNLWETEDAGYSEENFYTHAKDKQGHSVQINTKFPDYIVAAISELVQSKEIPEYATAQDFVRDSVHHRLHWCAKNRSRRISRLLPVMISIQESENQIKEVESLNDMVEKIRESCEKLYNFQDYEKLRGYIDRQKDNIEGIRDPYWGKAAKILEEYEKRLREK